MTIYLPSLTSRASVCGIIACVRAYVLRPLMLDGVGVRVLCVRASARVTFSPSLPLHSPQAAGRPPP